MAEGSSEKQGLSRRGFLKAAGATIGALLVGGAIKRGVDNLSESQTDLRNPDNLARLIGGPELFPGKHMNYPGATIREGAPVYKEPRKERSGEVADIGTTRIGTQTLMGTLATGESIRVEDLLLVLKEADQFTSKEWFRPITHEGITKNIDISKSWGMFEVKGQKLPESIKGLYEYGMACVPIEGVNIDFGGRFEPDPQKITFSGEINLGRIIS